VFRGGWTLEAAQAVSPGADAAVLLETLIDASLIKRTENEAGSRFTMLETVRQFAAELLAKSERAYAVRLRRTDFFIGALLQNYGTYFAAVEREHANLTATLEWTRDAGEDDRFVYLCSQLTNFWERGGRGEEARYWIDLATRLIAREESNTVDEEMGQAPSTPFSFRRGVFLMAKQTLLDAFGDREAAAEVGIRIFEGYRRIGNPLGGRTALFNAGSALVQVDLRRALEIMEQCLPLERAASEEGRANPAILSELACVTQMLGQAERAATFLADALTLSAERGDRDLGGQYYALHEATRAALAEGNFSLAQERSEAFLRLARRIKDVGSEVTALCTLAVLARRDGDREREEALLSEAVAVAGKHPDLNTTRMLRRQSAESHLIRGEAAGGAALVYEAMTTIRGRARSFRPSLYSLLLLLAEAEWAEWLEGGDPQGPDRASRLLGAASGVAERLGLLAPDHLDWERAMRLRAALTERRGPERLASEAAAGAALDDEAALEFALTAG